MKNKKLVYILFPLTLIVWGLIFYKIFSAVEDEEFTNGGRPSSKVSIIDTTSTINFELIANYSDPFLSKKTSRHPAAFQSSTPVHSVSIINKPSNVPTSPPVVIWPQITYVGIIENKKKGSKIGIVRIDNSEVLIKEKEINSSIQFERIYKDSIVVAFNKEKKVIRK